MKATNMHRAQEALKELKAFDNILALIHHTNGINGHIDVKVELDNSYQQDGWSYYVESAGRMSQKIKEIILEDVKKRRERVAAVLTELGVDYES